MPELPEVETVRVQLWSKLSGQMISRVEVFNKKTVGSDTSFGRKLKGLTFADINRVGKLLIFSFHKKPELYLLGHLKMTGQFFFVDKKGELTGGGHEVSAADTNHFPNRHTRVAFHLQAGGALYFNDMRLFGYLRLADSKDLEETHARFGPEPIALDFDKEKFASALKKRKSSIKAVLLDQSFVAGLGNIYVDEALFYAGVRPTRRADKLTKKEALLLADGARDILLEAIKHGGTTFQHFIDAEGKRGNHTEHLQVFGRQGKACYRCGGTIKKTRVAGRGTHYCPDCQR
ncbi:DNA-formamidopyrimidine glycosylase [Candidatus Kaiserbacteria bacterium RIFOXYB1_FULL_46_14]|uniref:Formamidopyrimidine-DNA glycosylase n=1 Tax=Candidatus Kaiserbacteria bacterium RIFOXYB1_FULL_46_14 TaxID=1798531 RepID=A0A1F6FJL4_9BACT|nr:MAG: DNA-formamidopyrimidine glycosylase [Candidatus Kaiserbacteria bacterium RIFOXYB1_FULL_46_14]